MRNLSPLRSSFTLGTAVLLVGIAGLWSWSKHSTGIRINPFSNPEEKRLPATAMAATIETPHSTSGVEQTPKPSAVSPVDGIKERLRRAAAERNDPVEREAFLQSAVKGIPRALYGSLIAALSLPTADQLDGEMARAILLRWAWEEPTNVAAWAIDHVDSPLRSEALAVAAQRWVAQSPDTLLTWAANLSPADRQWVLLRSGDFLGRTDPALFAVWHEAIRPGRERDQLELSIAREWARRDPNEVAAALASNTGPQFDEWRRLTIAGLSNQLSIMNGPDAARFVAEKIPAGPTQDEAALGAVVAWAQQDPEAARAWIERSPSVDFRARASQVLLGYWLESDSAGAQAFAKSLPPGVVSDQAHERVAQHLAASHSVDAIHWAEGISDVSRRAATLAFVVAEWQRQDPAAAQSYLRQRPEVAVNFNPGG